MRLPGAAAKAARAAPPFLLSFQAEGGIRDWTVTGVQPCALPISAFRVSKYSPRQPIIAVTPSENILRRLSLAWGVLSVRRPEPLGLKEDFEQAAEVVMTAGIAGRGELIVITAGLPLAVPGSTNLVKVHRI